MLAINGAAIQESLAWDGEVVSFHVLKIFGLF
jgi:hypothetical protein